MTTLTKLIVSFILSLLLLSCEFNTGWGSGVTGDGNVITKEQRLQSEFNEIHVSRGLDVYLTQGTSDKVTIEADGNLHDIIIVNINNGVLEITAEDNIRSASSKKVLVNFKNIDKIVATSGSDVFSTHTIHTDNLELETNSGSDMDLEINTRKLYCLSTSGSDLELTGTVVSFKAEANSGSDIDAGDLLAEKSTVKATSGASISVNTSQELIAKANSGGDITYYGNPEKVEKSEGVSGGIARK
ncbi:head GIN domain-containing protein [Hanstruepera marina]|uniref:head GIN domain-containing protein n=1 Tax=Hanstruepera marina TaxID=2873265 RepID=UPI001CA6CFC3|nr:head GIN domain-containing protein [Hanstruepera marina]